MRARGTWSGNGGGRAREATCKSVSAKVVNAVGVVRRRVTPYVVSRGDSFPLEKISFLPHDRVERVRDGS